MAEQQQNSSSQGTPAETQDDAASLAEAALRAAQDAVQDLGNATDPTPLDLPAFDRADGSAAPRGIDLLADVNLNVKIELGRTRMLVEDVLKLAEGAVVELDKLAGDPVDVYVNERLIARGEVLVLNDNFCVRINEIVRGSGEETEQGKAGAA